VILHLNCTSTGEEKTAARSTATAKQATAGAGGSDATPADVKNFVASAATMSTITLTWDSAKGADGYDITYAVGNTAPKDCTKGRVIAVDDGELETAEVTGLSANTTYSFRICSDFGDATEGETLTAETTPANPATFDAASGGQTSVNLTWSAVAGIEGYSIAYAAGATAPTDCLSGTQLTALSSATSLAVTNLAAGTQFSFRICASNGSWNSAGITDSATTATIDATITGAPTGERINHTLNVTIAGTNVTHYAFKLVAASVDCADASGYSSLDTPAAIATPITATTNSLSYGLVKLCVVGRDTAGNWQAFSMATTASWTKMPVFDAMYSVDTISANSYFREYVTNASGAWVTQDIVGGGLNSPKTSIVTTSADALYFNADGALFGSDSIIYGPYAGAYNWPATVAFDPGGKGTFAGLKGSMATNSNDKFHLVSSGKINTGSTAQLAHATNKSGAWVNTNITTYANNAVDSTTNSSIAIASNDDVLLISVRKKTTTAYVLEYRKYTDSNSTWSAATEIMPSNCTAMLHTEIGLDSSNKIHVAYSCNTASTCIAGYGTYDGTTWANEATVDVINTSVCTVEYSIYSPSISVDSTGKAHISYINVPNNRVMYPTNASGAWVGTIVATPTSTDRAIITMDPNDNPYVLYSDLSAKNLLLAHKLSGTWASQTAYGGGDLSVAAVSGNPEDIIVRGAKGRNNRP
jgi:hypothetical protein